MKKVILGFLASVVCGMVYTTIQNESLMTSMNDLSLQNVEALSSSESGSYHCWLDGSVLCPNGSYCKYVYTGYSL